MKITCLLENTAVSKEMKPGHGLSLYIQTRDHRLLFDLGPDERTLENAEKLGIDLGQAEAAVISHGHYDHGGGLGAFLGINPGARVIMTQGAATGRFAVQVPGAPPREIGLDRKLVADSQCRCIHGDEPLSETLALFTGFGPGPLFPLGNATLFSHARNPSAGQMIPDHFHHEQALLVTENGKKVLFTGCSHSGISHMLSTVLERTGLDHIDTVIGGFHLFNPSTGKTEPRERLDTLAGELSRFSKTLFYTGHCTGEKAFSHLKHHLGEQLRPLSTGAVIHI